MTMADRIRAMMGRSDGRHHKTASRHRARDDTLGGIRRDAAQAARHAATTEAATARVEQDAPEVAAHYGQHVEAPVPDSIDFSCPDCGTPLTAFRKRRVGRKYRGATYHCADCREVWEVSWGAAGEDVQATAA
jgi:predicted RNA-binding Zn-ribbon protein involved in translation (DUF1610 family)